MRHFILKLFLFVILFLPVIYSQSLSTVEWFPMSSGMSTTVDAVAVNGNDVYAGGLFSLAGGVQVNMIAKWDGTNWSSLGGGVNGQVTSIAIIGNDVYAAGDFSMAGSVPANNIAKWDGVSWSALGSGLNEMVLTLVVSGTDIYAGGFFTEAGGVAANRIAKWNGSSWSALGEGINNEVDAIAVDGNIVYAGGYFTTAGRENVNSIARWDGTTWTQMGEGIIGIVRTIIVKDGNIFAGGIFLTAGGNSANRIARWDGNSWSALGAGLNGTVFSMTSFGNDIYVGGMFTTAGGIPANRIAKYDIVNETWSPLGTGLSGSVDAMAVQTSTGSMIIGGSFGQTVSGLTLNYIGRFTDSDNPLPAELVSFEAKLNNNNVTLTWLTSSESNNRGFEIERKVSSPQSSVSNSEFVSVGYTEGQGTSTEQHTYSFIDENLPAGRQGISSGIYHYRLKQIDFDGTFEYSNIVEVEIQFVNNFSLKQNYPNPFNPSTKISWQSPIGSWQTLKIYDLLGNEVATLINEYKEAGRYEVDFFAIGGSAFGGDGSTLPSGVYYYTLKSGSFVETRKMILLK